MSLFSDTGFQRIHLFEFIIFFFLFKSAILMVSVCGVKALKVSVSLAFYKDQGIPGYIRIINDIDSILAPGTWVTAI